MPGHWTGSPPLYKGLNSDLTHLLEYLQLDTYGSEQLVHNQTIHKEVLLCTFRNMKT